MKSNATYASVDDLPLPPPPATYGLPTGWQSNQQMSATSANNFPPPPPELDCYGSYGSDINGNQYRREHVSCVPDRMPENGIYANLPAPMVSMQL